jgi:hypothetical protein
MILFCHLSRLVHRCTGIISKWTEMKMDLNCSCRSRGCRITRVETYIYFRRTNARTHGIQMRLQNSPNFFLHFIGRTHVYACLINQLEAQATKLQSFYNVPLSVDHSRLVRPSKIHRLFLFACPHPLWQPTVLGIGGENGDEWIGSQDEFTV